MAAKPKSLKDKTPKKRSRKAAKKPAKKTKRKYEHRNPGPVTEAFLTAELSEDLRDAWARLRAFCHSLGEQRIYASHNCIMFAGKVCYGFVRPKKSFLELCLFLPRKLESPLVKKIYPSSKVKFAHLVKLVHADQVEEPLTDWIREARNFELAQRR